MSRSIFSVIICCLVTLFAADFAVAQIDPVSGNQRSRNGQEELPKNIRETLAKQRIEREKKEYDELLKRTEEAVKLSEEIESSFDVAGSVSTEDLKRLEKLEKLVKKIRSDLGGNDDEDKNAEEEAPATRESAFKSLQSAAGKLLDEIKKSTRYSISAVAIQSSNALLKVLKFIRFGN